MTVKHCRADAETAKDYSTDVLNAEDCRTDAVTAEDFI